MARRLLQAGKWVLFVLGALLALSPLAMGVLAHRAERQLERALKDIAARGKPLELTQLARPSIPDEENAALVYQKAFDAMRLSEQEKSLIGDIAAGKITLDDSAVAARASNILIRNRDALRLIHQASAMPRCDWRLEWSKGYYLTFPQFAKLRQCSRLLGFESMVLLHEGRVDEAVEACGANFRLANAADEPILIGQLVRYAIIGIAFRSFGLVLRDSQPSSRVCRFLAAEIAKIDLIPSFIETMKGERAFGWSMFALLRRARDPARALKEMTSGKEVSGHRPASRVRPSYLFRWWLASEGVFYLRMTEKAITKSKLPYRETAGLPLLEDEIAKARRRWWALFPMGAILAPVFERANAKRDDALARVGLAQVSLLLKAYKAERGGCPESLGELGKFAGRELPIDPFSGKPFVYRREGKGFLLYSWGVNLKDDGGTPPPKRRYEEGDIVIRCLR